MSTEKKVDEDLSYRDKMGEKKEKTTGHYFETPWTESHPLGDWYNPLRRRGMGHDYDFGSL
ncbi:MAG: hypothetical protein HY832_00120 [Candidatus Aenigmarchaeota archaeon]|nr:hypothetical protein [Candidatus Aenigmarchaeota archaeon]